MSTDISTPTGCAAPATDTVPFTMPVPPPDPPPDLPAPPRAQAPAPPAAPAPGRRSAWDPLLRRVLDVVVAVLALLLTAPVLVLIALWVRLDSPGPALFRQQRLGRDRRPFTMLKFRSMRLGGDDTRHRELIEAELRGAPTASGGSTKLDEDPRITRAGRFLRSTSLDELPQLINVLRGDMSLVGPRPCLCWEAELFPDRFADRFTVRPGLTGLWQVSGRSTISTLEMLELDVSYVRRRRVWLDLWILVLTIPVLLRGDGAR